MNLQFQVNDELCIGCGECAKDCPFQLIAMEEDLPTISPENEEKCVRCQHCFAVCSTGALSILGLDPADSLPVSGSPVEPMHLSSLMQGRRSIRRYKQEAVDGKDLDLLMKTVSYAPTGVNNCQVHFTLIDDPKIMNQVRDRVYARLKHLHETDSFPEALAPMKHYIIDAIENSRDTIFRDAPHMVIASSPKTGPSPEIDCHIALTYFELMAASMEIGTVWCGLAKAVLMMITPEILKELAIPDSHLIGYVMMFGKPDVTYYRTIQRTEMKVNRIKELG